MSNNSLDGGIFPGRQVDPDNPDYPALVVGFNQRFVGEPKYVTVSGSNTELVRDALQKAIDSHHRPITVRGGGHCYEDFVSGNVGGVIIDLSALNRVYEDDGLFCVEGGCTLWNVYTQLFKQYGVTIPGGSCYSVGAGGHVIGGGYGLLSRKHGLTVDYLRRVEVVRVNAAGQAEIVTVDRDSTDPVEQTMFWAHTGGGGGNFGIVTRYWFESPPPAPKTAWLQSVAWEWDGMTQDKFTDIVNNYGQFLADHSVPGDPFADLFALLPLTHVSQGQFVLTVQSVAGPELIETFLDAIEPQGQTHVAQRVPVGFHLMVPHHTAKELPWLDATQTLNGSGPNQRGKYKSAYMIEPFPEEQIQTICDHLHADSGDSIQGLLQVDSYGCQINAVASGATAIPQRSSIMKLQYQVYWTDPAGDNLNLGWIRDFYNAMYGPQGPMPDGILDGCYVNYPDVDLIDWPYLYYKDGYPRLQQAKLAWDPCNIFHHQQSIQPPD
jgi:FAD/FMN-containing dehydrogenase